jgi:hypothetical protein
MTNPTDTGTTLVLLDPTSDDGESALDLLDVQDRHVTLMVLISGPASRSLRDFAHAEEMYTSDAGWRYLEQVAGRMSPHPERLEMVNASGPDACTEIVEIAAGQAVRRVLLPSSVDRYERGLHGQIARVVSAPIVVASVHAVVG